MSFQNKSNPALFSLLIFTTPLAKLNAEGLASRFDALSAVRHEAFRRECDRERRTDFRHAARLVRLKADSQIATVEARIAEEEAARRGTMGTVTMGTNAYDPATGQWSEGTPDFAKGFVASQETFDQLGLSKLGELCHAASATVATTEELSGERALSIVAELRKYLITEEFDADSLDAIQQILDGRTMPGSDDPETLLHRAAELQAAFWDALSAVERALDVEIDSTDDLSGLSVDDLKDEDDEDDEDEGTCDTPGCTNSLADGEGEDGLCGTCADKKANGPQQCNGEETHHEDGGRTPVTVRCDVMVDPNDADEHYFATPCGTFCNACMEDHAKGCGVCASEFDLDGPEPAAEPIG